VAAIAAPDAAPKSGDSKAPAVVNPFTKAARRKTETFLDVSQNLGASAVQLQQVDIPATGYLRHLLISVEVSGISAATHAADAPWNLIDSIQLSDVNGSPIVLLSGFDLFLANLFGGYSQNADPRKLPDYAADADSTSFTLRVPAEIIQRNAFGSLVNLNSAMTYKLRITLAPSADVYSAVTGTPSVHVTGIVESWSNPPATDLRGQANATTPPALGTTQNWSTQALPIVNGRNTHRLSRVGNTIRNLVLVARDAAGARSAAQLPDDIALYFDGNQVHNVPVAYLEQRMVELYGYAAADLPAGVIVLPFTDDFDGTPGEEVGDYYMSTSGATRLEFQGTWPAAGSLEVTTNDILAFAGSGGAGATLGAQA
jgi:hypothetical protein